MADRIMPDGTPDRSPDAPSGGVSRRAALKVLGLATGGLAAGGAAGCAPERTGAAAEAGSATGAAPAAAAKPFFTAHERETVTMLADYVIPRDDRSGSASDAGVPAWMDAFLADADTEDATRERMRGGLAWLDGECVRRHGAAFVRCTDPQRRAVLDDIAYPKRARPEMSHGVAFFNRFRDLTASGFYSSRIGWQDLRYEGNVAVPVWNGCPDAAMQRLGVSMAIMDARPTAGRTPGTRA